MDFLSSLCYNRNITWVKYFTKEVWFMDWKCFETLYVLDTDPERVPNREDCQRYFGSREMALEEVEHLKAEYGSLKTAGKAILTDLLREYAQIHQVRRITKRMLDHSETLPTSGKVTKSLGLGVMDECLRAAGLLPNFPTDNELLEALSQYSVMLGRTPKQSDFILGRGPYAASTYVNRFGSFANALRKIGMEPSVPTPRGTKRIEQAEIGFYTYMPM